MATQTKRKRGAQPGNTNALKHGFYSRSFRSGETDDLEAFLRSGLEDEVALLRIFLRRTFEMAEGIDDLEDAQATLNVLGAAATRIAHLLRTQKLLNGTGHDAAMAISAAISEVAQEMGLLHS